MAGEVHTETGIKSDGYLTVKRAELRIHARNAFCRVKTASLKGYKLADSICRRLLQRQDLGERSPGWLAARARAVDSKSLQKLGKAVLFCALLRGGACVTVCV